MGTNFYLMSRNKKLMREHFAVETEYDIKDIEYAIVDEPYLGYEIHLNKLSWGWRPLFQRHKTIKTFKELEEFCLKNKSVISIYKAKEQLAKERFHVHERLWCKERYWEDPDYPFDWTEGEFC